MEPKKLYKSSSNKILCGVCAGLAEYLNLDISIIRLITAFICLCGGTGVVLYIIAALILPER